MGYLYGPFLIGTSLFTGESMHDKFGWMFTLYTWICLSEQWTVNKRTYRKINLLLEFLKKSFISDIWYLEIILMGMFIIILEKLVPKLRLRNFLKLYVWYVSMNFWFYCLKLQNFGAFFQTFVYCLISIVLPKITNFQFSILCWGPLNII